MHKSALEAIKLGQSNNFPYNKFYKVNVKSFFLILNHGSKRFFIFLLTPCKTKSSANKTFFYKEG